MDKYVIEPLFNGPNTICKNQHKCVCAKIDPICALTHTHIYANLRIICIFSLSEKEIFFRRFSFGTRYHMQKGFSFTFHFFSSSSSSPITHKKTKTFGMKVNPSGCAVRFDAVCMTKESRNDRIEEKPNVQQWNSLWKIDKGSCTIAELKWLWNSWLRDFGIR